MQLGAERQSKSCRMAMTMLSEDGNVCEGNEDQ